MPDVSAEVSDMDEDEQEAARERLGEEGGRA